MNAPFKSPHITLMTLAGIARWKRQQSSLFQGDALFHIHGMRCGGDEPSNLEDNKYEHDDG
jgi:hypothetical protein